MYNHTQTWIKFGFIIVLLLVSCGWPGVLATPTATTQREKWIIDLLENPPCQPPCWENITVGATTIGESVSILSNMDDVIISGPYKDDIYGQTTIYWEFPGNQSGGKAFTGADGSIIILLDLSLNRNQLLKPEEVINLYGNPDYILVRDCESVGLSLYCIVHLIYDRGLALELFLQSKQNKIEISSDTNVESIWFFPHGLQGYENVLSENQLDIPASLMKWEGYTKYKYP
jgi:hypothetical protein